MCNILVIWLVTLIVQLSSQSTAVAFLGSVLKMDVFRSLEMYPVFYLSLHNSVIVTVQKLDRDFCIILSEPAAFPCFIILAFSTSTFNMQGCHECYSFGLTFPH